MATFGLRLTAGYSGSPSQQWFYLENGDHADSGKKSTPENHRMALTTKMHFASMQPAMTAAARLGKPLALRKKKQPQMTRTPVRES
jgi:hypothetical protein